MCVASRRRQCRVLAAPMSGLGSELGQVRADAAPFVSGFGAEEFAKHRRGDPGRNLLGCPAEVLR
jgi:hypothetical protein